MGIRSHVLARRGGQQETDGADAGMAAWDDNLADTARPVVRMAEAADLDDYRILLQVAGTD